MPFNSTWKTSKVHANGWSMAQTVYAWQVAAGGPRAHALRCSEWWPTVFLQPRFPLEGNCSEHQRYAWLFIASLSTKGRQMHIKNNLLWYNKSLTWKHRLHFCVP